MTAKVCPSGHALSINIVLPYGAGRHYCATCGWTDAEPADSKYNESMIELERDNPPTSGS